MLVAARGAETISMAHDGDARPGTGTPGEAPVVASNEAPTAAADETAFDDYPWMKDITGGK